MGQCVGPTQQDPIQQGGRGNARDVRAHEGAALPPCWTHERGFAAYERFVAAALPRVLDTRTLISCRWDTGADGHRRIMANPPPPPHAPALAPHGVANTAHPSLTTGFGVFF